MDDPDGTPVTSGPEQAPTLLASPGPTRTERDSLGEMEIPDFVLWGIHTARALENFPISRRAISNYPDLIRALALVKQAAARANRDLGVLSAEKADIIDKVCARIADGEWHDQFVVGVVQGGAGTSTNMNANEVIANAGLQMMGCELGEYQALHPIDDVNRSQSTNDVYPTAIKLAMVFGLRRLLTEHALLIESFAAKSREFENVLKVGRTQLQDAVPMTLGQEFHGFATTLQEDSDRLGEVIPWLNEINLGATAIGTGITADPRYAEAVRRHLEELTGLPQETAPDLIEATADAGIFMTVSGTLKRAAVKLSKICNDLRLLSSGPQAGLGEISLPARQAGSSIMPGKVNPVLPEATLMVCFQVVGNDAAVTAAGASGAFELNVAMPVIARNVLESVRLLAASSRELARRCVDGITADADRMRTYAESSPSVVTPLNKHLGYEEAAKVAKAALAEGRTIREQVLAMGYVERGDLTEAELDAALDVESMTGR